VPESLSFNFPHRLPLSRTRVFPASCVENSSPCTWARTVVWLQYCVLDMVSACDDLMELAPTFGIGSHDFGAHFGDPGAGVGADGDFDDRVAGEMFGQDSQGRRVRSV
jgi:hypothetical protein